MMMSRSDLNESEASFLWAIARFGGGESLVRLLAQQTQGALQPKVSVLAGMAAGERRELAQQWAVADEVSRSHYVGSGLSGGDLWQELGEFSVQRISLVSSEEMLARMLQIGLFQFAVVLREQEPRQVVRIRRGMGVELAALLDLYLSHQRSVCALEKVRIQEVLVVLSRSYEGLDVRLGHLGMYFVACSAGLRFRCRVEAIAKGLGGELGRVFLRYYWRSFKSSRVGLEEIAREALEELSRVHASGENHG